MKSKLEQEFLQFKKYKYYTDVTEENRNTTLKIRKQKHLKKLMFINGKGSDGLKC